MLVAVVWEVIRILHTERDILKLLWGVIFCKWDFFFFCLKYKQLKINQVSTVQYYLPLLKNMRRISCVFPTVHTYKHGEHMNSQKIGLIPFKLAKSCSIFRYRYLAITTFCFNSLPSTVCAPHLTSSNRTTNSCIFLKPFSPRWRSLVVLQGMTS